jgi:hypothetical protein
MAIGLRGGDRLRPGGGGGVADSRGEAARERRQPGGAGQLVGSGRGPGRGEGGGDEQAAQRRQWRAVAEASSEQWEVGEGGG